MVMQNCGRSAVRHSLKPKTRNQGTRVSVQGRAEAEALLEKEPQEGGTAVCKPSPSRRVREARKSHEGSAQSSPTSER
jgi:hypothetical protein